MSNGYVNKIMVVGYLGRQPELRHSAKGVPYVHLSVATSREVRNAEGEEKRETYWHKATVWGKNAENCAKFLTTGSRVYVEGELQLKSWTDKEGETRRSAEINVDQVQFLGGPNPRKKVAEESAALAH